MGVNTADDRKIALDYMKANEVTFPNILDTSDAANQAVSQYETLGGMSASCPDIASYLLGISVIVFEDIYHMCLRITRARARMTPCPTFYPPTTLATVLDSSRGTAIAP